MHPQHPPSTRPPPTPRIPTAHIANSAFCPSLFAHPLHHVCPPHPLIRDALSCAGDPAANQSRARRGRGQASVAAKKHQRDAASRWCAEAPLTRCELGSAESRGDAWLRCLGSGGFALEMQMQMQMRSGCLGRREGGWMGEGQRRVLLAREVLVAMLSIACSRAAMKARSRPFLRFLVVYSVHHGPGPTLSDDS